MTKECNSESELTPLLCDGFMEGKCTLGHMESCGCKAKYKVTQVNGPLLRHVCGRHVQTFRAGIRQGRKYVIERIE